MTAAGGTPAASRSRPAQAHRSTVASPADPGKRSSKRARNASSTVKQHGPMLGPTTAPSRRPRRRQRRGRLADDAGEHAAPAGVHGGELRPVGAARDDDDGHAVGVAHHEAEAGRGGQQAVVVVDHRLAVEGSAARLRVAHPRQRGAVDLAGYDEPLVAARRRPRRSAAGSRARCTGSSSTDRPRFSEANGAGETPPSLVGKAADHPGALPLQPAQAAGSHATRARNVRSCAQPPGSSRYAQSSTLPIVDWKTCGAASMTTRSPMKT